jgi:hypothetical protein
MRIEHLARVAVGLLAVGLGLAAAATVPAQGTVKDLFTPRGMVTDKAIGPSKSVQQCPSHGTLKRPEQGDTGAVIETSQIALGVMDAGNLIYDPYGGGGDAPYDGIGAAGLYFFWSGNEVLMSGCYCEGWGVADALTGRYGQAGDDFGYDNIVVDSFTTTPTSAVSVVRVLDPDTEAGVFKVTHDFHPSLTDYLFECTVTIQNISPATVNAKYRRVMDWDMMPGGGPWEVVTLKRNGATKVGLTNNNGFAEGNPLSDPQWPYEVPYTTGDFVDYGPADQGAQFNLNFGMLAPNQSVTFTFYYGGAPDQISAMAALAQVGAEAYSLAKPDPYSGGFDLPASSDWNAIYPGGTPNSAVFGLKGVGGKKVVAPSSFLDDNLRSALCVAWDPGYYQWTIMSGHGSYNTYVGLGQVLNGNAKIASFATDPVVLNFTYSVLQKKASGYFIDPYKNYSPLTDKLTTDDPPCGSGGGPPRRR